MLLSMEVMARLAPHLIAKQVHQRFLYSEYENQIDSTTKGKMLTWISNERGARGNLYHGQPVEIAVLGSSTSVDSLLDQRQSWAQQLEAKMGNQLVHVDNYSRDGANQGDAFHILQEFQKAGRRYDILLLMVRINPVNMWTNEKREVPLRETFRYWGNWASGPEPIVFPGLLVRRLKAHAMSEPRLDKLLNVVIGMFSGSKKPSKKPSKHPIPLSRSNRELRLSGNVRLIDEPVPFDAEDKKWVVDVTFKILRDAARVADRVYMLTQPIAYDEKEHPGVSNKWFSLSPVKSKEDGYYSNKNIAKHNRKLYTIMAQVARSHGTPVIDLDGHMRPLIRERDDLFDDKWHFAPAGAEVAAEFVARNLDVSTARSAAP